MVEHRCRTRAFTLVELLVVIAIIGVLVALLLPAVQAAREAARRMSCSNNLKQIGLGYHNHHDVNGEFPLGGQNAPDGDPCCQGEHNVRTQWSWPYHLLPYIEQKNVHDLTDHNQVYRSTVDVYYCPSRRAPSTYGGSNHARIDYAGNAGTSGTGDNGVVQRSDRDPVTFAHITDGTSNTLLVGEKQTDVSQLGGGCCDDNENPYNPGWEVDIYRRGTSIPAPDSQHPQKLSGSNSNSQVFGSSHPGGANMLLCDGSVRLVTYTVDTETFRRFCVRDDGLVNGEL